jgi:hypothetical protein
MKSPSAAVTESSTIKLKNTATMIFDERSASQRTINTPVMAVRVVADGALLDDGELVVVHRHLAGKIDGRTEPRFEIQVCDGLPNSRGGVGSGLQRAEIQHRIDLQKVPQLSRLRCRSLRKLLPGKSGVPVR